MLSLMRRQLKISFVETGLDVRITTYRGYQIVLRAFTNKSHAATIIGDYLYIEGGEISQLVQGKERKGAGSLLTLFWFSNNPAEADLLRSQGHPLHQSLRNVEAGGCQNKSDPKRCPGGSESGNIYG